MYLSFERFLGLALAYFSQVQTWKAAKSVKVE